MDIPGPGIAPSWGVCLGRGRQSARCSAVLGHVRGTRDIGIGSMWPKGVAQGRRKDLQGGGLRRSAGGWEFVGDLHRGREHGMADERVLGSGSFVEEVHRTVAAQSTPVPRAVALARLPTLLQRCAGRWGVTVEELCAGSRRRVVSQARAVAAGLAIRRLGLPMAEVARTLGVSSVAIYHALFALRCDPRSPGIERRRPDAT